jgi:hypothetical protein
MLISIPEPLGFLGPVVHAVSEASWEGACEAETVHPEVASFEGRAGEEPVELVVFRVQMRLVLSWQLKELFANNLHVPQHTGSDTP